MRDAYICDYIRTPIGRFGGSLSQVRADDLAAVPLRALVERNPGVDWAAVDDAIYGCANQAGEDNRNVARMAVLLSGLPESTAAVTVNRLCASGLEAIGQAARSICCGEADLILAGGVESMTRAPYVLSKSADAFGRNQTLEDTSLGWRLINPLMHARFGTDSMPKTAQNLAEHYGIARENQDAYALRSQLRAEHARKQGWLAEEISPITVPARAGNVVVAADEQARPDSNAALLAGLRPILGADTCITAGNASALNDGAAVLMLASSEALDRHRLTPIARVLGMASAGVAPRLMGIGPVPAIGRLLSRLRLNLADFDRIEINEAFAAQVLACARELGLAEDAGFLNANGGAIALGHPLGASGARLAMTAAFALRRHRERRALISLCVGVGQGLTLAIERV